MKRDMKDRDSSFIHLLSSLCLTPGVKKKKRPVAKFETQIKFIHSVIYYFIFPTNVAEGQETAVDGENACLICSRTWKS